jgi:hypothetical protein
LIGARRDVELEEDGDMEDGIWDEQDEEEDVEDEEDGSLVSVKPDIFSVAFCSRCFWTIKKLVVK